MKYSSGKFHLAGGGTLHGNQDVDKKVLGVYVRGTFKTNFWSKLGFCPNWLDPRPPPRTLGFPKRKKNVYFAFPAVLSIFFFMKKSHFLVIGDFSSQLLPKICFCGSPYGQCHNQHTHNFALISSSLLCSSSM